MSQKNQKRQNRPHCPSSDCEWGRRKDTSRQTKMPFDLIRKDLKDSHIHIKEGQEAHLKEILNETTKVRTEILQCQHCQRIYAWRQENYIEGLRGEELGHY